jgi:hypothetical protein
MFRKYKQHFLRQKYVHTALQATRKLQGTGSIGVRVRLNDSCQTPSIPGIFSDIPLWH